MSSGAAVWLVAGGEPGAERFGQLVQRLRKEKRMSVEELAHEAGLSVGTIRAIEQARRAPSEESGVRLLRRLLPEGALSVGHTAETEMRQTRPEITFIDPASGARVLLEFRARTAGDNRRWSSDKPPVGESKAEAFIREFLADDARRIEWQRRFAAGIAPVLPVLEDLQARARRPASDADFGRVVRRLATHNEFRLGLLEKLLDLWDRVDKGAADEWERDRASQLANLLDPYVFPDEEAPSSSE
jgi:transcriptional regulator with XRE-family HTH domain